ncbi:MAG: tryptophan-rich sensory protein [Bacteroidota bacterium]
MLLRALLVIIAVVGIIAFNGLANALPLGGNTIGELANRFDTYFTPAPYVFSIWGIIYLGLIAFAIVQLLPSRRDDAGLDAIRLPFLVSCLANVGWLTLWHYEQFTWSVLAMLTLLGSLLTIYVRLRERPRLHQGLYRWTVSAIFSVYLGWVTVATLANISAVLDYLGWDGSPLTPTVWAGLLCGVAVVLGAVLLVRHADALFNAVLAWAFVGLAVKYEPLFWPVPAEAAAGIAGLFVVIALVAQRQRVAQPAL